ncbi:MAG TPA: hypothetical protein DIW43_08020 [Spongiibacteraceae bacterium]|nr:hypothetical protein [Spongiibacteraceae bacterium]HCS27386.1 hypothetical protein [Spongiibacteraceae bacterium]
MKIQIASTLGLNNHRRRLRHNADHLQHQHILNHIASSRSLWPATDRKVGDYNTLSAKTHTDNLHALNMLSAI